MRGCLLDLVHSRRLAYQLRLAKWQFFSAISARRTYVSVLSKYVKDFEMYPLK